MYDGPEGGNPMKRPKKRLSAGLRLFLAVTSSVIAGILLLALGVSALFSYANAPPKTQAGFSPENPVRDRGVTF